MTKEEGVSMLEGNISYSVWTPYDAFEAAETLLDALKADNVTSAHHGDTETRRHGENGGT